MYGRVYKNRIIKVGEKEMIKTKSLSKRYINFLVGILVMCVAGIVAYHCGIDFGEALYYALFY